MNEKYVYFALRSGGAHFPVVGGENLEKFGNMIVQECCKIIGDAVNQREPASTYVEKIRQHFNIA